MACKFGIETPCNECGMCKDINQSKEIVTNADRIRSMSDEELAILLMCPAEFDTAFNKNSSCNGEMNRNCRECTLKWLQSQGSRWNK